MIFLNFTELEEKLDSKTAKYILIQMVSRHTDDRSMMEQVPGFEVRTAKASFGTASYLYANDNKQYRLSLIVDVETGEILYSYGALDGDLILYKAFFKGVMKNIKE